MAEYEGKQGRWITTKTGKHIFIENGKTVEEALGEAFESFTYDADDSFDSEPDFAEAHGPEGMFDNNNLDKTEIDDYEHKEKCLKAFKGIWDAPYAVVKNHFKDQFMKHKVNDPELENILFDMLSKKINVQRLWMTFTTREGSYYNSYSRKLVIELSGSSDAKTMGALFHELGHALDNNGSSKYYSSDYVSKKYGMTLTDMLEEELLEADMEDILNEYNRLGKLNDATYMDYVNGKMSEKDRLNYKARVYYGAYLSICDTVQGTFGLNYVKEKFNNWTHEPGYFDWESEKYPEQARIHNARNRGTEFFAEMTDDLVNDHEHLFSNLIKKHAPKSYEIYFEILKEAYGYEK